MKKIKNFFTGDIEGFIAYLVIVFAIGYGVYITVKFVLESNGWN